MGFDRWLQTADETTANFDSLLVREREARPLDGTIEKMVGLRSSSGRVSPTWKASLDVDCVDCVCACDVTRVVWRDAWRREERNGRSIYSSRRGFEPDGDRGVIYKDKKRRAS